MDYELRTLLNLEFEAREKVYKSWKICVTIGATDTSSEHTVETKTTGSTLIADSIDELVVCHQEGDVDSERCASSDGIENVWVDAHV